MDTNKLFEKAYNKLNNEIPIKATLQQYTKLSNGVLAYFKLNTKMVSREKIKSALNDTLGKEFNVEYFTRDGLNVKAYCSTTLQKSYKKLKGSNANRISANVFQTNDDKIWTLENINGEKFLARDIQDDMEEILNERRNFTNMTASFIQERTIIPNKNSIVVFYDDKANTMKAGVVLASDDNTSIVNDGVISYNINNEVISAIDTDGVNELLNEEIENLKKLDEELTDSDLKERAVRYFTYLYKNDKNMQDKVVEIINNMN